VRSPSWSPRVLDDEAVRGVPDDREGVQPGGTPNPLDHAKSIPWPAETRRQPAAMYPGRGQHRVALHDRGLDVTHVTIDDSVVGSNRAPRGLAGALGPKLPIRDALAATRPQVRPARGRGHPVLVPALHRTAEARAFVVLALPLVISPAHLVQHPRTDAVATPHPPGPRRSRNHPTEADIDDRGECESNAGALGPLIEDSGQPSMVRSRGKRPQ